jgi:hypothetical protein
MLDGIDNKQSTKERNAIVQREIAPYCFLLRSISEMVCESLLKYPSANKPKEDD